MIRKVAAFPGSKVVAKMLEYVKVIPLADHVWSTGELVEAALHGTIAEPQGKRHGRFTVIDGGAA